MSDDLKTFKVEHRCSSCGSTSLYWEGSHYWDAETQSFRAGDDVGDGPFCGDCGAEHCGEPVDIETGQIVAAHPLKMDVFISVEDADRIKEQLNAERQARAQERMKSEAAERRAEEEAQAWAASAE